MSFSRTLPSLMGLGMTTSSEINTGVSTAGAAVAAAAEAGLLTTIGLTSAIVPIIGPVVAGITLLIGALGIGNGCGGTCTEATQVVNQAEPTLQANLAAAQQTVAQNGCLTGAEQQQLVANFNTVWQQVLSQCGQIPAPGGTQCISDRQQGSNKINGTNWFNMYLVPIQQMPVCASVSASSGSSGTAGIAGIADELISNPILLVALALIGVSLLSRN